ncbi:MAG TPA: thioredoxin family protein [Opitutaceae bacterium]|nr:thioredoxin family protein [Opitutaceae bacterium]
MFRRASLGLAALAALAAAPLRADPEYPKMGPDIYDVRADGAAQVAAALGQAAAQHKRVIVDFGANWCIWCRRLHSTFENDPAVARALGRDFIVVLVDVNTRRGVKRNADLNARYGNPTGHGIPVLVVLDPDGRQLTTKDTGELEEGAAHSPAKITAFLAAWAPPGH